MPFYHFAGKRTADSQSKSSSKKAKVKMTPVEKNVATVMEALTNEETIVPGPESCRSKLVAVASVALQIPKDERHADQDAVLGMLREVFATEKGRWEARVADATSTLEKATVERTEKMGAKDVADAELKAQKDVVRERMEAQSKATEVLKECQQELSAALTQRADASVKKEELVKTQMHHLSDHQTIKDLKEDPALDHIYENPKGNSFHHRWLVASVSSLLKGMGAEEALVKAVPQILSRKPSERGSCDEIALQQLDSYFLNHLSSLTTKIEAADAIVAERAIGVTTWQARVEVAEDKKRESDEALQAADAHKETLQEALNCARKVLKEHRAVVKSWDAKVATEQCGLYKVENVLEAFEFLEEVAAQSAETPTEMPAEKLLDDMDTGAVSEEKIILELPTAKGKEIEVQMNFEDMPSPVPAPEEEAMEAEEMGAQSAETPTEMPAEKLVDDMDTGAVSEEKIILELPTAKGKEIEVQMNFEDMPSPVPAPEEEAMEAEEVAAQSVETPTEMPAEKLVDDMDTGAVSEEKIILELSTAKGKEIEVQMNFEDMPSPAKRARLSLGADAPMVVA